MAWNPQSSPLPTAARYGSVAIVFHWTMVVLVVFVGTLGLLHDDWPDAMQAFWINMHAVIGLGLWCILVARMAWRLTHRPPPLPVDSSALARRLSGLVHWTLYLLLFVIPLIGVVTFIYHGRVFDFGLLQINPGIKKDHTVFHPTEDIHGYLAYALFGLVALHVVAALWHRLYRGDGVLARMWPSR